ncbi:hypothetical protein FE74_14585, partial [Staphylococcus aureus]
CQRPSTPEESSDPRTLWQGTPGKSFTRPPRTRKTLCSYKICPRPRMNELITMMFDKRTRAYLRNAELVFIGVIVLTRIHPPRF